MKLQPLEYAVRLGWAEGFIQCPGRMGRKIVQHHTDTLGVRIMNIGQITHTSGEIARGSLVCHLHVTPGFVRIEEHEQIGRAIAFIFAIVPLGLPSCSPPSRENPPQRHPNLRRQSQRHRVLRPIRRDIRVPIPNRRPVNIHHLPAPIDNPHLPDPGPRI